VITQFKIFFLPKFKIFPLLPTTNIQTNTNINNIKPMIKLKNIEDIKWNKWGGMIHPNDSLIQHNDSLMKVKDLTKEIYYEEE